MLHILLSEREAILAREHSSARESVLGALAGLDVESYLLAGGASRGDLSAIRGRLLGDAGQVS